MKIFTCRGRPAQRGFSAIEVSIFMVAAMIVATVSTVALLSLGADAAQAGSQAADSGLRHAAGPVQVQGPVIATSGDIDVDGNDVIDSSDITAVTNLKLILSADADGGVDLTPPYTADGLGTDPDFSTTQTGTVISILTEDLSVTSAAWTVSFPGEDDGDMVLEAGERAEVNLWLHTADISNGWFDLGSGTGDPFVDSAAEALTARGSVTILVNPDSAPESATERTLPLELTASMLLQ